MAGSVFEQESDRYDAWYETASGADEGSGSIGGDQCHRRPDRAGCRSGWRSPRGWFSGVCSEAVILTRSCVRPVRICLHDVMCGNLQYHFNEAQVKSELTVFERG
jgi:hypothetical protein